MQQAQQLKELLTEDSILVAPGIYDGLSARLAMQAGFKVIYASGGAIARSCGLPDLGLLSFHEVLQRLAQIREVCSTPLIIDADTGFGNRLNVRRSMQYFSQLDIAALHLEDQEFPKRCGHLDGKSLVSQEEMVDKVKVAKDSLQDTLLIARTDAIAVEGIDSALERAQAYSEAGADMIFVEAPQSREHIEMIANTIKAPKLINMFAGGKTPVLPLDELQRLGYQVMIIPSDLQRASIAAMQRTLTAIAESGANHNLTDELASFQEREQIIGTKAYLS